MHLSQSVAEEGESVNFTIPRKEPLGVGQPSALPAVRAPPAAQIGMAAPHPAKRPDFLSGPWGGYHASSVPGEPHPGRKRHTESCKKRSGRAEQGAVSSFPWLHVQQGEQLPVTLCAKVGKAHFCCPQSFPRGSHPPSGRTDGLRKRLQSQGLLVLAQLA